MSEINRIRELEIRLSDLPEYVRNQVYGHLVEYDNDNDEDEEIRIDACINGGRQSECGRDCYEVTFYFRLSKEPDSQEYCHG